MDHPSVWDMILRLIVSAVLGGLIGFERETHERPAGLRTHILVSVGATLITLSSYAISTSVAGFFFDPGRVTAQIVTGIGFLGAGTIIHQGSIVRGLTTAASIWTIAGIGIAVGIGGDMYYVATAASFIVFLTLTIVSRVERYLMVKGAIRNISLTVQKDQDTIGRVLGMLSQHSEELRVLGSREAAEGKQIIRVSVRRERGFNETGLNTDLASSKDVISYRWE